MQLKPDQFPQHLQRGLSPFYLVSGDEPLLVTEACDQLRQAAREAGFTDRKVFHVEAGFDWESVLLESGSLSLFAERRLIEIRLPGGKPGTQGAKALEEMTRNPDSETVVLVVTGKLEAATKKTKWLKALESAGVWVEIWPLPAGQLPAWIRRRMQAQGLQPSEDAVTLLAERVEGNLLAADQEIRKLALLADTADVTAETVLDAVADSSRHDVFKLVEAVQACQTGRVFRILANLRAEGAQPPMIVSVMAKECRTLYRVAHSLQAGRNPEAVMDELRVWRNRRSVVGGMARRRPAAFWLGCLRRCMRIDRIVKGRAPGNAWDELLQLSVSMSGTTA